MDKLYFTKRKKFKDYVEGMHLNARFKSYLTADDFIDQNLSVYLFYPEIFYQAFADGSRRVRSLNYLNLAGYLYYRSMIEMDKLVDYGLPSDKESQKSLVLLLSTICQEESVKLLTTIFPIHSAFWKIWESRREEYLRGVQIDKSNVQNISIEDYEDYADCKSAFGKVAIDVVYFLCGRAKKKNYLRLLDSHRNFSVGLQLADDLLDFKEDINSKQVNLAFILVKEKLKEKDIDADSMDVKLLTKHLYIQGVAEHMLVKAIEYFQKALVQCIGLNLDYWEKTIEKKIKESESLLMHIRSYQKVVFKKASFSKKLFIKTDGDSLQCQIDLAKQFILNSQNSDGSWNEFYNNAGISNVWSTAFITENLIEAGTGTGSPSIIKAINFLKNNRQGNLWGYSTTWIPDTDSTTFALMALAFAKSDYKDDLNKWVKQQSKDGGFSTYPRRNELLRLLGNEFNNKVDGWIQNHTCVSSAALYFISRFEGPRTPVHNKLLNYVLTSKKENSLWPSYWWSSPIYSTSYALRSLLLSGFEPTDKDILKSFKALASMQEADGSFATSRGEKSAFFTAQALSAFAQSPKILKPFLKNAQMASGWLQENQFDDGSFSSSACLQIPEAGVLDADTVKNWDRKFSRTSNVLVEDFMRLFSTAVSLQALSSFQSVKQF